MGARGPKRKPTHLKVVEGRRGAAKAEAKEPRARPITDAEPTTELTKRELELFHMAMIELQPMGHLGNIDLPTVTMWAAAYGQWERIHDAALGDLFVTDTDGNRRRNMAVGMERDAIASVRQLAAELGMSPASRAGMKLMARPARSLDDLLAGRTE